MEDFCIARQRFGFPLEKYCARLEIADKMLNLRNRIPCFHTCTVIETRVEVWENEKLMEYAIAYNGVHFSMFSTQL